MELWNFAFDFTENHTLLILGIIFAIGLSWGHAFLGLPIQGFAIAGIYFLPTVIFLIIFNTAVLTWHDVDLLSYTNIHIESWGKWNTGDIIPLDFSLKVWRMKG